MYHQVVVSTGGGAVIRPINWCVFFSSMIYNINLGSFGNNVSNFVFRKYMHKGISIWLDVPLEALAHRIAAVGTGSRPLLHDDESGDTYTAVVLT